MTKTVSNEEKEFLRFLEESKSHGFIQNYQYEPVSFELIPKKTEIFFRELKRKKTLKTVEKTIYQGHKYTPDFIFTPTEKFLERAHKLRVNTDGSIIVDTKGAYNLHGGDRIFPIHQKLLYHVYGLHVNKVVPIEFFQRFGICPDDLRWMKNRKKPTKRKHYKNIISFEEYEQKTKQE